MLPPFGNSVSVAISIHLADKVKILLLLYGIAVLLLRAVIGCSTSLTL